MIAFRLGRVADRLRSRLAELSCGAPLRPPEHGTAEPPPEPEPEPEYLHPEVLAAPPGFFAPTTEATAKAEETNMAETTSTTTAAAVPAAAKTGLLSKIESGFNIAETWITAISAKVRTVFSAAETIEPAIADGIGGLLGKAEAFLAAATPAVAGEGLNFPADSVAYSAFVDFVQEWQAVASTVESAIQKLESE